MDQPVREDRQQFGKLTGGLSKKDKGMGGRLYAPGVGENDEDEYESVSLE
jgi:hypothetical protein